jgi:CheY-like chemotaxis protein
VPTSRRIWIVDDSRLDAENARRVLVRDHSVTIFTDGSAMLEALSSEERPDVLILDWIMPGISGLEVCRFLRSGVARTQDISILMLTAHGGTDQVVEGLDAGANDYVAKPYADDELRARVDVLLRSLDQLDLAIRSEAENRRLLGSAPEAHLIVESDGKVCFVNELAVIAFDLSAEYLLGLNIAELLPGLDLSIQHASGARSGPDLEIGSRVFAPSWRFIHEDGRTAILLHDVTHRPHLAKRRLSPVSVRRTNTV